MKRILNENVYTAEFYTLQDSLWIEYNKKHMHFSHFLRLAKTGESGANLILAEVKKKMIDDRWGGDLIAYLKHFFGKYNDRFDIVIRQNIRHMGKNIVTFDKTEK